jgi:hypothetical protein
MIIRRYSKYRLLKDKLMSSTWSGAKRNDEMRATIIEELSSIEWEELKEKK